MVWLAALPLDGVGVPVDAESARGRAEDILSRPEFQPPPESFLDRVFGWIGEQLGRFLLSPSTAGTRGLVAFALIGGLIALVVWVIVRSAGAPGRSRVRADDDDVVYGTDNIRRPEVWQAEADRLAASGDFRGALRCRHQALVAEWITDGVIDHVVGRTAQECHAAASTATDLAADASASVVATFDDVWYGGAAVDEAAYRRFSDACATLVPTSTSRRRNGAGV